MHGLSRSGGGVNRNLPLVQSRLNLTMFALRRRNSHERTGYALYSAAVAAARDPFLYRTIGVSDTPDGRFDLICLHVFLVVRRLTGLSPPGPVLAQAVFDAMFNDMDVNLRESGVGDLSVGRKVRAMWEAFNGRTAAYRGALETDDAAALESALRRNVWRGAPAAMAGELARITLAQDAHLRQQPLSRLANGAIDFMRPAEVAG
jgi:cytochrome b pre-mRNA-processing protein 3